MVDVESDDAEVFGLDKVFEKGGCCEVHVLHGISVDESRMYEEVVTDEVSCNGHNC